MLSWKTRLKIYMKENTKETLEDIIANTLGVKDMDIKFETCSHSEFIAWSNKYVYFSDSCDGADYINSVLRNPTKNSFKKEELI